jgi:peptidoglycan/LPS O-acetylase OafA/YrhL
MPGACWALVAGLLLVAATPLAGPGLFFPATTAEGLFKHLVYAAVGGLIVVTGIFADPAGRYARVLSLPILRHVGLISYSIFCIHLPVLYAVMQIGDFQLFGGHALTIWAITLMITLACSEVLYRLVEKPGMRLKNFGNTLSAGKAPSRKPQASTTRY